VLVARRNQQEYYDLRIANEEIEKCMPPDFCLLSLISLDPYSCSEFCCLQFVSCQELHVVLVLNHLLFLCR